MTKGVNLPTGDFLGAMTRPKTDVTEFSYPLDQSDQAWRHLWLSTLIIDEHWEEMHVHPLRLDMHID
jgi:hypothetical protein